MKKLVLVALLSLVVLVGCANKDVINDDVVVNTGIDLTNCEAYFDGCNNCSVKDGKLDACTLMYCENPTEPKCIKYKNLDLSPQSSENNTEKQILNMANPASVKCEQDGGTLEILEGTGGQYGICHFPDGSSCEEWAYFRGECPSK